MEVLGSVSTFVCYVQPEGGSAPVNEVEVVGGGVKVGTKQQQYGTAMYRLEDLKTVLFCNADGTPLAELAEVKAKQLKKLFDTDEAYGAWAQNHAITKGGENTERGTFVSIGGLKQLCCRACWAGIGTLRGSYAGLEAKLRMLDGIVAKADEEGKECESAVFPSALALGAARELTLTASSTSSYCDVCGASQPKGAPMRSCRKHDYDVCARCCGGADDAACALSHRCPTCAYVVPAPAAGACADDDYGNGQIPPPPSCVLAGAVVSEGCELLGLLRRLRELGDACGRCCAAQPDVGMSAWASAPLEQEHETLALRVIDAVEEVVEGAAGADEGCGAKGEAGAPSQLPAARAALLRHLVAVCVALRHAEAANPVPYSAVEVRRGRLRVADGVGTGSGWGDDSDDGEALAPARVAQGYSAVLQLRALVPAQRRAEFALADAACPRLSLQPWLPNFPCAADGGGDDDGDGGDGRDGGALLRALRQVADLGDECGRWCAQHRKLNWRQSHAAREEKLAQLSARMVELAPCATAAAQQHVVRVTVRLAQLVKAFEAGKDGMSKAAGAVVKRQSALIQLRYLHGREGEGPAKHCATAECARLGDEMDEAWFAFVEEERRALMAEPWENDPEPAVVGTWTFETGDTEQWDKPVLRPQLRQYVPPELGYVAGNVEASEEATGELSELGSRYVEEHLLPEARRVLPLLEAAVRRVAVALGPASDVRVPPLKTLLRMSEKAGVGAAAFAGEADHLLNEYPRQASNVDVARVMLVVPTPPQVQQALALFKQQCEVARVKNRFSPEAPLYGYRDMLLNLKIDGVYCEVQLGLAPLVAVRRKMHKFYGVVRSIGMKPLISMAKPLSAEHVGAERVAEALAARQAGFLLEHCADGKLEEVAALLREGADADATDSMGQTPLIFASAGGHVEVARALLTHGCDVNRASSQEIVLAAHGERYGGRALSWACANAYPERKQEMEQLLREHGAV